MLKCFKNTFLLLCCASLNSLSLRQMIVGIIIKKLEIAFYFVGTALVLFSSSCEALLKVVQFYCFPALLRISAIK